MVLILLLLTATALPAQDISASSFKLLENDLTANTTGTMERDQNGEIAALIKVVTTEQGFVFDGGMVGVVKTKQGVGEVWVYVPHGIKKITIQHPQLGVLRDYYFPIAIDKAKTYEMVLSTGKVKTVVTHSVNKQFVIFNVKPTNAVVELDDEILTVDSEGYATKSLPFGTYDYRVSCSDYHTTAGKVTVNVQGKAEVNVKLRPNFGWIRFDGENRYHGAHIYIDNERVGQLPFTTGNIKSGEHQVKVVKNMYKTYVQQVMVSDAETTEMNVQLVPNFANVTLTTDDDSEIWIDGSRKGKGRWSGPLEIGSYTVETKRESHRTMSEVMQINSVEERTIELKSPTPIYGSLEISSTPLRATIYIDGVEVGETPLMKSDVLVGTRRVAFRKDGYVSMDKTVEVKENSENSISVGLSKVQPDLSANKSADKSGLQLAKNSTPQPPKVKTPRKSASNKKKSNFKIDDGWGCLIGIDAGYISGNIHDDDGFYYGGELGVTYNRLSLIADAKSIAIGTYTMCDNDMAASNEQSHSVRLIRFSTRFGYTFGRRFLFTPQLGVLWGHSIFTGKKYITNELPSWDGVDNNLDRVLANKDYTAINSNIMYSAKMKYWPTLSLRFEYRFNSGFGIYLNPEICTRDIGFNDGYIAWGAGLSMKF